jgi:phage-related protein
MLERSSNVNNLFVLNCSEKSDIPLWFVNFTCVAVNLWVNLPVLARKVKAGNEYDIYAIEDGGRCEILDFLSSLEASNRVEFSKLIALFDMTADMGRITNPHKFKLLDDGIYEFKTHGGVRVLCFFDGRCIVVLTHGFMKKKKIDSEIKRAVNLKYKYVVAKAQNTLFYKNEDL